MAHNPAEVLYRFAARVRELKDFPDGNLIQSLTQSAIEYVSLAPQISEIISTMLIDLNTIAPYKRPLFYLIDSILKRAGGPYPLLFQQYFMASFHTMVNDVSDEDRKKLTFLFGTWGERRLFPLDLLEMMKTHLARPRVSFLSQYAVVFIMVRESRQSRTRKSNIYLGKEDWLFLHLLTNIFFSNWGVDSSCKTFSFV